jgi:hypothetical protein
MAGTRPVRLASLREVEEFLVVHEDPTALLHQAPLAQVHYVDPATLVRWVRDEVGDAELADALDAAIDLRRPFGFLVPGIKALLVERIEQCQALLEPQAVEA